MERNAGHTGAGQVGGTAGDGAPDGGGTGRFVARLAVVVAVVFQIVVLVPFTVASGLVAPLGAILLLYALWLVGAASLALMVRRRPLMAPLVPALNAVLLWLAITAGELWLGWTA